MLPPQLSLPTSADFARIVRKGRRKGTATVVVYLTKHTADEGLVRCGGPRFGLIVSKAVGNAVIRHRVSRRLRHVCADLAQVGAVPVQCDVVLRALPRSATASSADLRGDVVRAVDKLLS